MPAYYSCTVREFLHVPTSQIVGDLATKIPDSGFRRFETAGIDAWRDEVETLKAQLSILSNSLPSALNWGILLEFPIPRRQRRIDVVLLAGKLIFVLEFKSVGGAGASASAKQVEDYALDLSLFHAPSHDCAIVPVLVGPNLKAKYLRNNDRWVRPLAVAPPESLAGMIHSIVDSEPSARQDQIALFEWNNGAYHPLPTIIEAAMALYAGMSVREITHSRAAAADLASTTNFALQAIVNAQRNDEKIICFVTGVPGAGKTLVGMNLAHNPEIHGGGRPAVFMSGNGPLVKILREALAQDASRRKRTLITNERKKVSTFVQNIYNFVREHLEMPRSQAPFEFAIIFDEAQRAWSAEHNQKRNRKKGPAWHVSEPEMVLEIMDRHQGWAAIVALVGGGQEINEGEAGIAEWGRALTKKYSHWKVFAPPEALQGSDELAGSSIFDKQYPGNIIQEAALHLRTSSRSHQAAELSTWVNRVLAGEESAARSLSAGFEQFPIVLCRNLTIAKRWLQIMTRGKRRCGLVASSGAARLRAYGVEISLGFRQGYPFDHWFLDDSEDIRSSYQLEVAASEFEIQGLELDYVGLCWGGDFIWDPTRKRWDRLQFTGGSWKHVADPDRALRVINKYRVLMTRAREGLVIWVPEGDEQDPTRSVQAMNETADYLVHCGARPLQEEAHGAIRA